MTARKASLQLITVQLPCEEADDFTFELSERWGLQPIQVERPESAHAWVELYFEDDAEFRRVLRKLRAAYPSRVFHTSRRAAKEWLSFWRHHFHVQEVGRRLRLAPVWERIPRSAPRRITIRIDPGASFGTGDHFTTRFCLEALETIADGGGTPSFLDVGTGSGILAIAAAKLGFKRCVGTEHDPLALKQAVRNVRLNRVADRVRLKEEDLDLAPPKGTFDVVAANLISSLLVRHASRLCGVTRKWLILSGIREHEADMVAESFMSQGATEVSRDGDGEWVGIRMELSRS